MPSWDNERGHVETLIKDKTVKCLILFNKRIKFSGKKSEVKLEDLERKKYNILGAFINTETKVLIL